MPRKIKDLVLLTKPEITIIHYLASRPEIVSKLGLTYLQVKEGVSYSKTIVKETMGDLVILGLAKQNTAEREGVGRKSHIYTFYHPSLVKLSDCFSNIDNFTMRDEERLLVPLMMALAQSTMYQIDAIRFTNNPDLDLIIKRKSDVFTRIEHYPDVVYGLTDKGKSWTEQLSRIQIILQKCMLLFINKS